MALAYSTTGNTEILQIADAVAREKGIGREQVIEALENAIQVAGRRKYGHEHNIRAEIDRKSGEIRLYRVTDVVELVENEVTQITLAEAKRRNKNLEIGDSIKDALPPIDFGRIAAQTAKQVIVQKVRDAERDKQFDEYKERSGEIVSGTVKRIEYGNVTIDFGRTEGFLRRDELIPRETFRTGDRIRAYIYDVRREKSGPQIFLTRTRPEFMAKLFAQEVPEIYDGIIEIKAVARDPGSRAKIAVYSRDSNVNPVLSCVGVRGARVQAVVGELQGEKIDIVQWSPDAATFVVNALSSAEVSKVVIDENKERIEVVVPDDQLSLAIGRRGQNVRLASQLVGWNIDILTEEVESNRRAEEFNALSKLFTDALNVEEVIAQLLATEGFTTVEEVAYVPLDDLTSIEGFDEAVATELRARAREWLETQKRDSEEKLRGLGMEDKLLALGLPNEALIKLGENKVLTLDDFADLSSAEFMDFVPDSHLSQEEIDSMIMKAREHWFEDEKK
jgi:N utilization substance protein A